MEARGGERRYSSYSFTTSALDGGEWSASRPGRAFTPGGRTPGTQCAGGWVGPRAGLDTEAIGKILCPYRGSNPDRPVVQPVVRHYTAWANPAPKPVSMSAYCPLAPSLSTCYSALQVSTPQLSNNDCPWQSPTTNSRPQDTATRPERCLLHKHFWDTDRRFKDAYCLC
jgi:hypothetical protein